MVKTRRSPTHNVIVTIYINARHELVSALVDQQDPLGRVRATLCAPACPSGGARSDAGRCAPPACLWDRATPVGRERTRRAGAVDIEADRLGELRHRHHVVFAVVPDGVRVPIGDVLAAVPVDGEATQGPRELGALGRADARDLLLDTHLAADGVHRDDGTAVLGAHLEPARLVGHVDHRVRVLEGAARRLALRADAPQVRAQTRVDARAEEDERRVVGVAVGHDEQPGGGRHAARHVHERVALVGGGARVGAAQREAVHARDAVRGVAHGLARVGRAVEGQVEEGRQRVGRVVQAGQVRAAIRVILLDATDGDARLAWSHGEQHADDAGDGEDGWSPAALIGAVPSLREQLAPAYKLRRAPRDDKQT
eukprot:scaffold37342_cov63-Phaeocystis_antarctica.AAC.2